MKKNLIALAILAATGSAAMAQSSVTLFGVADAAVKYGNGTAAKLTTLGSGGNATSRIGFRGVEDLGDGLQAGFWLEGGLVMNSGSGQATNTNNQASGATTAGGLTFNRRATVSVMSAGAGELRLGRDLAVTYRSVSDFDPFGDVGVGNNLMDSAISLSSITRGVRVSNTVNYFTPANLGGFYGQAQYYFGGNASDVAATATTAAIGKKDGSGGGLRLGFAQGPLSIAASYGATNFLATGNQSTTNVAASYDLGVVKLLAIYNEDRVKATAARVQLKGQSYLVGLTAPAGPGEIRATYGSYKRKENLAAGDKQADKFAVGYVYNLSKRTAIYTTVALLKNKNGAGQVLNGSLLSNANDRSSGFDIGLRHAF